MLLNRSWGIISLTVAYFWQLYTLWILVQLHEAVPGKRYNRYVELAQAAFGEKTLKNKKIKIQSLFLQQYYHYSFLNLKHSKLERNDNDDEI